MDFQSRQVPVQTAKYSTLICFMLIGVVSETFFIHYKLTSQSDTLRLRIDELERQQGLNIRELAVLRSIGSHKQQLFVKHVKDLHKTIQLRVRRGIQKSSKPILSTLNTLKSQIFQLMRDDLVDKGVCNNVTLVCKKGERGPRGKSGPRGYKGEVGGKGDKGIAGPQGKIGPPGTIGQKGQKGDPGQHGRSLEKPRILTRLQAQIIKPESNNLTLFCEASGYPQPNVRWKFGKKIDNSRYAFLVKGGLMISHVNKSDEGGIQCIAESILGKDVSETELIVHTKPKVILPSTTMTATDGIPFEVVCRADGTPLPKLKWKFGFGRINARQTLSKDRRNLTLHFDKPTIYDTGTYICEAGNIIGIDVQQIRIFINSGKGCSFYRGIGKSGLYNINPDGKQPFQVFCDMDTSNGGWTVIQRRVDGSVDFFKNWVDYKLGFGNLETEFWLGNKKIHRLTKRKNMMIRFDLEDADGNKAYAEYRTFYIDGENDNYKLHVSSYSGTAGDSFSYHNGMQFSTTDRDNDKSGSNCASHYHSAWWFSACFETNLNGKYLNGPHKTSWRGVIWYHYKGDSNSLKKTEMKVRPVF